MSRLAGTGLFVSVCACLTPSYAASSTAVGGVAEPLQVPAWLKQAPGYSKPVTLSVHANPLNSVLASLSRSSSSSITACEELADQRVSLVVSKRPVYRVMTDLADALGHCRRSEPEVEWVAQKGGACLQLTSAGRAKRRDPQGRAAKTALAWLSDLRKYAAASPLDRKSMKSECPSVQEHQQMGDSMGIQPLLDALAGLGPAGLDDLVAQGSLSQGGPDSKERPIRLVAGDQPGLYEFVRPISANEDVGVMLDTLGVGHVSSTDPDEIARDRDSGEPIKVDPPFVMDGRESGKRVSAPEALELWATASGRPICGEVFLTARQSLYIDRGAPYVLLTSICRQFGLDWREAGGVVLVWCKAWAFDREADVPERTLDKIRSQQPKKGPVLLRALLGAWRTGPLRRATACRALNLPYPAGVSGRSSLDILVAAPPFIVAEACRSGVATVSNPDGALCAAIANVTQGAVTGAVTIEIGLDPGRRTKEPVTLVSIRDESGAPPVIGRIYMVAPK